jgi:hypothetical protein
LAKDSSTYLLKALPNDKHPQYVKCIVKGRINLYAFNLYNSGGNNEASLYAGKEHGNLVQLKHAFSHPDRYEKKAFTDLIFDDPALQNEVQEAIKHHYNFDNISEYIKRYNNAYLKAGKAAN